MIKVLDKVSLIEILVSSKILISEYFLKFYLTLSNITTVSFIEYPTIVSIAAIIGKLNSNWVRQKTPIVKITS